MHCAKLQLWKMHSVKYIKVLRKYKDIKVIEENSKHLCYKVFNNKNVVIGNSTSDNSYLWSIKWVMSTVCHLRMINSVSS